MNEWIVIWTVIGLCLIIERWAAAVEDSTLTVLITPRHKHHK